MSETNPTPEQSGALSVEQAIEAIRPPAQEPQTPATPQPEPAPVEAAEEGDDTQSEALPEAEDEGGQDDPAPADEEADNTDQGEAPVIEYPRSWAAKDREVFAALPEEARAVILAREGERDRAVSKAQQEASEARKRAEQEAEGYLSLKPQLESLLERADATFADRWGRMDANAWAAWVQEDPASAMAARFQMEAEQAELSALKEQAKNAEQQEIQKFVRDEMEKLPQVAPELADPAQGQQRRTELAKFLLEVGVPREQLPRVSAVEMSIAYDAMRFRKLQAAKPPVKPATPTQQPPQRRPVAPTAAPQRDSQTRSIEQLSARLAKSGSEEDAIRLLQARRK